jgi:hypothetical protein
LVLILVFEAASRGATITVTNTADSGPGSLRAALDASANGDTIDLTGVSGTITLTTGHLPVTNSLTIIGPGPENLAIDGNFPSKTNRVFHIAKGPTAGVMVLISGLTITNAHFDGAGIFVYRSDVTVSNCVITRNIGRFYAGGIFSSVGAPGSTSTVTIVNSILTGNWGAGVGGAIYQNGQDGTAILNIIGSTISSNSAAGVGAAGIKNDGSPTGNAMVFVTNSTFIGNSTTGDGGAIQNDGVSGKASAVIVNSTFIGNSANFGGAIFNDGSGSGQAETTLINSTFSGNSAASRGGGICDSFLFGRGTMTQTLISSTLVDNSASLGGAIYNLGKLEIGNTILRAGSLGSNIAGSGTIVSLGHNLSSDNGNGGLTNTSDQIDIDPMVGPLQANGGPVLTHALLPSSPAMDQGKNLGGTSADGRGFPRIFDDPAIVNVAGGDGTDIGAYEAFEFRITAAKNFGNDLALRFLSLLGKNYEVQTCTNLILGTWSSIGASIPGTDGTVEAMITNAFMLPEQFYRIYQLP